MISDDPKPKPRAKFVLNRSASDARAALYREGKHKAPVVGDWHVLREAWSKKETYENRAK
jgi:hypothetical protein